MPRFGQSLAGSRTHSDYRYLGPEISDLRQRMAHRNASISRSTRNFNALKRFSRYKGPAVNHGPRQRALYAFSYAAMNRCQKRPYFVTKHSRLGRGPLNMQIGDQICILYSGETPFALRYEDGSNVAKLIGDAYLDGCMDLATMPDEGRGPDQIFTIR
jgi:hypothetical protein